jgi:hypothetical protein
LTGSVPKLQTDIAVWSGNHLGEEGSTDRGWSLMVKSVVDKAGENAALANFRIANDDDFERTHVKTIGAMTFLSVPFQCN